VWQNYDVQVLADTNPEPRDRAFPDWLIIGVMSANPVGTPPTGFWPNTTPRVNVFTGDPDFPYPAVGLRSPVSS